MFSWHPHSANTVNTPPPLAGARSTCWAPPPLAAPGPCCSPRGTPEAQSARAVASASSPTGEMGAVGGVHLCVLMHMYANVFVHDECVSLCVYICMCVCVCTRGELCVHHVSL